MINYYLQEIPGNKFNSSEDTPIFWHHANPKIGLFAFMYGLGGIIDGEEALNITSSLCRHIEQRTDVKQEKTAFLQELIKDAEERLLIGGGRRDRFPGLKAMLDIVWIGEKNKGYFVKVGAGKVYSLHNDGRIFSIGDDNPASLGLGKDVSVKVQNLSDYKGILLAPPDLFRRVTDSEAIKILQRNSGRQPLEKLLELEKKIFEPELALLDRYSPEELKGMLRLYGRDSFIPEEKEMLAGVVATVSSQTPELRERILSDLGVGHISLLYIDLGDTEGKEKMRLQAESTERIKLILDLEGAKSSAVAAQIIAEAGEKVARKETAAFKKQVEGLERLQQSIYSALGLDEVENPEEVVLTAIGHAKRRETELKKKLTDFEKQGQEVQSWLDAKGNELQMALDQYAKLEEEHQLLDRDYDSLQRHNIAVREKYEVMLAVSSKEKEHLDGELTEGREYSSILEGKVQRLTGVLETLVSAIGLAEFNSEQTEGLEEKAHEKLGEERQRYARVMDVLKDETHQREAYQAESCRLERVMVDIANKLMCVTLEKEALERGIHSKDDDFEKLLGEYQSMQREYEQILAVSSAHEELTEEAAGRGKKIAELLADYTQLEEDNKKLKGQVEEASGQIIRLHVDGEEYIERTRTAEERLRNLTEDAIRQGTVINGLRELVEASERWRLEYQRLHEENMEEIAGLRLQIEEYQSKEQDWERRLSEAVQSVRTETVIGETMGTEQGVRKEESQIITFSEESLQRIRAIADKYRVRK